MNAFRRRSVATILATVTLLAAGCGGDSVRFLGEKVKDPEPFLGTIEQAWRADLTKERVTLHKEARCYFSRGEESKEIDGLAFCGPARHYTETPVTEDGQELNGTDAPGAVGGTGYWDTYAFEGEPIEGGYQLANPTPETKGAAVPMGVTLFRLDGKTPPADGDKLAAPPPPPLAAGFVSVVHEEPTIAHPTTRPEVVVETPLYSYSVQPVGTADTVRSSEGKLHTPARGEEFIVTEVIASDGTWADDYAGDANDFPEEERVEASSIYSITTPAGRKSLSLLEAGGAQITSYIVASVPKGDTSTTLTIGVAGRDQTVNLVTGKVDAVPPTATVTVNQQYSTTTISIPEKDGHVFEGTHSNTFTDAWLTPFHPQKGWAAKGKTWLILETENAQSTWDLYDWGVEADFNASTVAQAKGVTYRNVVEAHPSISLEAGKTGWPLFEVDSTVRSFKITYQPNWHYQSNVRSWGISGKATFKPMTFTVTFPK